MNFTPDGLKRIEQAFQSLHDRAEQTERNLKSVEKLLSVAERAKARGRIRMGPIGSTPIDITEIATVVRTIRTERISPDGNSRN